MHLPMRDGVYRRLCIGEIFCATGLIFTVTEAARLDGVTTLTLAIESPPAAFGQFRLYSEHGRAKAGLDSPGTRANARVVPWIPAWKS
jgi:hypothetical protein